MSTEVSWTDVPGVPGPTAFGMTKNELRIDGRNPTKWIGESEVILSKKSLEHGSELEVDK